MFLPPQSPPVERRGLWLNSKYKANAVEPQCNKYVLDFNNVDSIGKGFQCQKSVTEEKYHHTCQCEGDK